MQEDELIDLIYGVRYRELFEKMTGISREILE